MRQGRGIQVDSLLVGAVKAFAIFKELAKVATCYVSTYVIWEVWAVETLTYGLITFTDASVSTN
jgi:hypothetical protein